MRLVGHHTALPWYFGPYITTYNKEVFKRAGLDENMPPKTMDELFEDAAKVGADGQGDYGIYGSPEWYMIAQLHGMGVKLLNNDNTAFDFADNEAAIAYVTRFAELYASGAIPKDSLTGEPRPRPPGPGVLLQPGHRLAALRGGQERRPERHLHLRHH